MFSNLYGLVTCSSIWCGIAHCFGMVFKCEKNYIMQKDAPRDVSTSLKVIDIARKLHGDSNKLNGLIEKNGHIHSDGKLNITNGSMASQTAETFMLLSIKIYSSS